MNPFEGGADHYDSWYSRHSAAYASELAAIRALLPPFRRGLEIGVGTGRFASQLGVAEGVEPIAAMAQIARQRGIKVHSGQAEALPLPDQSYDLVLMLTVLCFVADPLQSLCEARRVLRPQGRLIIAALDPQIPWVRQAHCTGRILRTASLMTMAELQILLDQSAWQVEEIRQTLSTSPDELKQPELPQSGYGQGGYVVLRCLPQEAKAVPTHLNYGGKPV